MRGRKPVPTPLRILRNNPRRRPLPENEPQPVPVLPPAPAYLDKAAREEWARTGAVLLELGLMTKIDVAAFAGYCQAYATWIEALAKIKTTGGRVIKSPTNRNVINPWVQIAKDAWAEMMKAAVEFGMSPSSRSRVKSAKKDEKSPLERYLGGSASAVRKQA